MTPHLCPTCGRGFSEPGFCPHDGVRLVVAALTNAPTYLDPQEFAPVVITPRAKFASADVTTEVAPDAERRPDLAREALAAQIAQSAQATYDAKQATAVRASQPVVEVLVSRDGASQDVRGVALPEHSDRIMTAPPPGLAVTALPFAEYDALIGTTLDGRYKLMRKIGEGAMGVVFAVRHNVIERPLALKILRRGYARDVNVVERFLREAKAASRIGHPNVVEVTDFGTSAEGVSYAVMEYLSGETLDRAIAVGPLQLSRVIDIAQQVARALAAAHVKGVIHRDLKSENIFLVERDGRRDFVKVVDFGVAKLTAIGDAEAAAEPRLTLAGSIMGTPEYMAPEQAAGRTDVDHRVDIYALGIILFEMVAGRMPFRGDSLMRTLAMQLFDPLPPLAQLRADVPVELIAVIERACDKRPEARFATMDELAAALERVKPKVAIATGGEASASKSMRLPVGMMAPTTASESAKPHRKKAGTTQRTLDGGGAYRGQTAGVDREEAASRPLRRNGAMWIAGALIAVGVFALTWAVASYLHGGREPSAPAQPTDVAVNATPVTPSVVVAPSPTPDAAATDAALMGGDRAANRDAGAPTSAASTQKHPSTRPNAALVPSLPNNVVMPSASRAKVSVRVYTYPDGGSIYLDRAYRGPSGVTIQLPFGTRGVITCQMFGYAEGAAPITFDGSMESLSCPMIRLGGCIDDIKNPYDKCPPASGSAP